MILACSPVLWIREDKLHELIACEGDTSGVIGEFKDETLSQEAGSGVSVALIFKLLPFSP